MRDTAIGYFAERVAKGDDCHSVKTKEKPSEAATSGGFFMGNWISGDVLHLSNL